jgi:hypothetical protein
MKIKVGEEGAMHRLRRIVGVLADPPRRNAAIRRRALRLLQAMQRRLEVPVPSVANRPVTTLVYRPIVPVGNQTVAPVADEDRDRRLAPLYARTRLNFGCGYDKRADHVNVDIDPACAPDVLVQPDDLAHFPQDHFEVILAKDVLEHVKRAESLQVLLHFNDWLKTGGTLHVQTTSILGVADRMRKYPGFDSEFGMTTCLFGNQMHAGDFHYTGFTETTLLAHLRAAGFEPSRPGLVDEWMFTVDATKVFSWSGWSMDTLSTPEFVLELFERALARTPSDLELRSWILDIDAHHLSRKEAARHVFNSHERLRLHAA